MNDPQPMPTDATLQRRCAEIVEWQRTGILSGTALSEYASAHWAGRHDALQMAERDTSLQAMEAVAKRGTPAPVGVEPVAWAFQHDDGTWHDPSLTEHSAGMKGLAPADQVLAMGRVPLTEAHRLFDAGWKAAARFCGREDVVADGLIGFGACPQFEAAFAAAHGIKQGGQHGAE